MLQVRLLGQFDVRLGGTRVTIPSRAGQSLFAYLILTAGTAHRRERLAGQFWPDTSDDNARRSLRHELWRIRKALSITQVPAADYLAATELTVAFNPDSEHWLDVAQLERPVSQEDRLDQQIGQVSLYQGELLPGLYDDWVVLERERVLALFEARMRQLLERLIHEQLWARLLEWSERWIALGGTPEPAYRALMLAYAALGDRSKVASTYKRCVEALQDGLAVEPSPETRSLHDQLMRGEAVAGVDLSARRVSLGRAPSLDDPPAPGAPPFKGLQYFEESDAALFFGREALISKLVARLHDSRFLAVVIGASGSGKSSIVRAGLVPALRRGEPLPDGTRPPDGSSGWQVHVLTPTTRPLEALALSLTRGSESVTAAATLMDDLARDPRSLYLFVRRAAAEREVADHLLLVVDQFEELFTLCRDAFEREAFIDNLLAAVGPESGGLITLVVTIRADFYPHLAQYPELRDAVARQQEYIGPMTIEELRRAIEEPARRGGWELQLGLVDLILRDVGEGPGALPLLSHALLETWKRRSGRLLTLKGYADSGGVRGAIAHTAESVFQELTPPQQAIARGIFVRLTELGDGTEDTRRRTSLRELVTHASEETEVRGVLTRLADARLITTSKEAAEVAHEALIREWPRLREWLAQDRQGLLLHRALTETASEWELLERDPDVLYRGARLSQAVEWAATHEESLNDLEREFLAASQELASREAAEREAQRQRELEAAQRLLAAEKARAEEQARSAQRLRRRARLLAGSLVLTAALAAAALWLAGRAEQQAALSSSRELAAAAIRDLEIDPERSLLLALQANEVARSLEAEDALHRAVLESRLRLVLRGHAQAVTTAAFSPDGARIATASADRMAIVWDAASGEELLTLSGHTAAINRIAFSPDGLFLATAGEDGTARVWDGTSGQELLALSGHTDFVDDVSFSSDGERLATASADGTARVWDAATGEPLLTLSGPPGWVLGVAFSPDGSRLATSHEDGSARVWDADTGEGLLRLAGHRDAVMSVAFGPACADASQAWCRPRLATSSLDGKVKIWDAVTGDELFELRGHGGVVYSVVFSPDGLRLATASSDTRAIVWDAIDGRELFTLAGHTGFVLDVAFSPQCVVLPDARSRQCGSRLITASADGTARLWDASPAHELFAVVGGVDSIDNPDSISRVAPISSVAFGPGCEGSSGEAEPCRSLMATAGDVVRLWDAGTGEALFSLTGHAGLVDSVAFSPDGTRLATASQDGTARVWDIDGRRQVHTLGVGDGPNIAIAFSPDGAHLAGTGENHAVTVWDVATGETSLTLAGHGGSVTSVAFSADGRRLATASADGARVWDAASGEQRLALADDTGETLVVALSPEGRLLAVSRADGTVQLWDADTGRLLSTLAGHHRAVFALAFTPDGTRLITGSSDGTAKIWDSATGEELLTLYGATGRVYGLAVNPDGTHLAAAGDDGAARVYLLRIEDLISLARSRVTRSWTTEECRRYLHVDECPPGP